MSTRPSNLKPKRKSTGDLPNSNRPSKQPRLTLDAFFSPKVSVTRSTGIDDVGKELREGERTMDVVLSAEQRGVLRMVVDGGKNVFFTGSA
ncbi:hypothetical protein OF83DRAFT_1262245, partial [Amylostereum chailletii]